MRILPGGDGEGRGANQEDTDSLEKYGAELALVRREYANSYYPLLRESPTYIHRALIFAFPGTIREKRRSRRRNKGEGAYLVDLYVFPVLFLSLAVFFFLNFLSLFEAGRLPGERQFTNIMDVATFRAMSEEERAAVKKEAVLMPAMVAPEGETANFENPPNENTMAMVIITVTLVIATLCIMLRAYGRVYLLRKVGIEEGE